MNYSKLDGQVRLNAVGSDDDYANEIKTDDQNGTKKNGLSRTHPDTTKSTLLGIELLPAPDHQKYYFIYQMDQNRHKQTENTIQHAKFWSKEYGLKYDHYTLSQN